MTTHALLNRRSQAALPADPHLVHAVCLLSRPGGRVLHCGAGEGALLPALLARGIDVRGVDARPVGDQPAAGRFSCAMPVALPFAAGQFFTVVVSGHWLDGLDDREQRLAVREIARVAENTVILATSDDSELRAWWEERFLEIGFRRHTRNLATRDFESLEDEGPGTILLFQTLTCAAAVSYPLHALRAERDLHMDMLRETGRRADAHIARYEWARGWIKPGDVVVDAACGLGYGTAILWDATEASRVIGLDVSASAVAYARANYTPGRPGVEFSACDVEPWDGWTDHSVDCIVSFETLEHLVDPARFLAGAQRVLKPGGRFLCSVPHAWVDETGHDPNPHHLHVFDLDTLVQAVSPFLLVDEIHAQSAGGHASRFAPRRLLRSVRWPAADAELVRDAEWLLLSGIKDPLPDGDVPYTETVFPSATDCPPNAIAFARDYRNPWAVHALVMGTFRVRSPHLLATLAERWLEMSPPDSADAGAALCVLAYRELDGAGRIESARLAVLMHDYCRRTPASPQARRWQVSLLFVRGQLHLRQGEATAAEACFRQCAAQDAAAFTPHLETKTTEAAWLAGRLALERGDPGAAAADWSGVTRALERLRSTPVANWLITPERPAAFEAGDGLREIAIAVDNAALSANALRRLRDPSGAWRPGSDAVDRNFQRNASRLLETVRGRGGEILALRADLDHTRAEVRAVRREVRRCRAERAALQAVVRRSQAVAPPDTRLRVGIFGTGDGAMDVWEALSELDVTDLCWFADNDPRTHGQKLLWVEVIAPGALPAHPVDVIVIGSMHVGAIRSQLLGLGFDARRILAPDVTQPMEQLRDLLRDELPQCS